MKKKTKKLLIVLITTLSWGSMGAFIALGAFLFDKITSRTGWTSEVRESIPIWIIFGVFSVAGFIIRQKLVMSTDKETKDS